MELNAYSQRSPAAHVVVVAAMALALALAILTMPDWTLFSLSTAGPGPSQPAVCNECAVVESIRSMDRAEYGDPSGVTIRGLGDDLMSVLALTAGALTGNRPNRAVEAGTVSEVTIRFDDGTTHVFRTTGSPKWQPGDRVRVVEGRIRADIQRPAGG